jgi:hypothetical protein
MVICGRIVACMLLLEGWTITWFEGESIEIKNCAMPVREFLVAVTDWFVFLLGCFDATFLDCLAVVLVVFDVDFEVGLGCRFVDLTVRFPAVWTLGGSAHSSSSSLVISKTPCRYLSFG